LQAINPVLILIFIPVFDYAIYPLLDKCKIPNRYTTHTHTLLEIFSSSFDTEVTVDWTKSF